MGVGERGGGGGRGLTIVILPACGQGDRAALRGVVESGWAD